VVDDWIEDEHLVIILKLKIVTIHITILINHIREVSDIGGIYRQGSFDDKEKNIVEVSTEDAYRMGMKSMLRWVKNNMDRKKTRVFFTSMSPTHAKLVTLTLFIEQFSP